MVDVCRVPSFNRLEESYGEDGYLSAVMGMAFVKGLQQGDLKKGVGACSKHYLGYGGGGDADEKEMMEEILLPHETMIRVAGSKCVMPGYHAVHGTKCVANSEILQDILRDYIGFDGMVVSDYTAIDQIPDLETPVEKAAAAINGGNDVDFPHGANYQHLQEAIDRGLVKPETLERAVKNVLRHKFRAGLFEKDAYLYSKDAIKLDTPEERQNTGSMAATEIAQIYLSPKDSTQQIRPIQLQGFARISLEPGQAKTVTTRLYVEQTGFYSHQNGVRQWNIVPGTYVLKVGASSADIRLSQEVILRGKAVAKPVRDHYFSESIVSQ